MSNDKNLKLTLHEVVSYAVLRMEFASDHNDRRCIFQEYKKWLGTYIDDWVSLKEIKKSSFIGYDDLSSQSFISKYRKVKQENKSYFQIVFDKMVI